MTGAIVGLGTGLGLLLVMLGLGRGSQTTGDAGRRSRLRRLIDESGTQRVAPGGVLLACGACGVMTALLLLAVTTLASVALLGGLVVGALPIGLLRRRARQRTAALRTAWPDTVDMLVSAVRAGMSLPEAVADLATRGPDRLRPGFAAFAADYRATGSFSAALLSLKRHLADPVADRVIASLLMARDVGGTDLGRVLATLSDFLREDARTRGEIEARQSWTVNAARLAVAAPWITLALLSTRPEALTAYASPAGTLLILVAGALTLIAYRVMLAVGRLPTEARVLR